MLPKVRLLPVLVTAFLLTGMFLATTTLQTQANSPTEIVFWHAMGRSRGKIVDNLVAKFNAKNPGIVVKSEFIKSAHPKGNNYNALYGKILENLAKGNPPDVSQVYENWTTQFIDIGALTPVDKYFAGPEGMDKASLNDIVPTFREANTFPVNGQNHVVTLPFNKSIYVLYYNKAIFNELGLKAPNTWTELRAAAKTIADKKNMAGVAFLPSVDIFGHYLYSNGGEFIDKSQRAAFGGQLGVNDINYWVDMVHKDRSAAATMEAADMFEKGQAAMYIETTSKIGGFRKVAGLNFGVKPIPKGNRTTCLFAGTNLAIFSKSTPEKQLAAWKFVRFMASPEVTTEWAIATGYLPVRTSAINSQAYQANIRQSPEYAVGIEALKNATVQPRVPAWETIRGILDDAMYEALSQKYPSTDVIEKAVSLSNDLLKSVTGNNQAKD